MKEEWFIGVVADQGEVAYPKALEKVFKLRNDVYQSLDWGEAGHDEFDDRSVIFAAIKGDPKSSSAEVVMTMRLILGRPLPLEEYFPDGIDFAKQLAEVSRLVGNPKIKNDKIKNKLVFEVYNYALQNGLVLYGLIEDWLIEHMKDSGVEMKKLTSGKALDHYDDTINYVVEIKTIKREQ